MATAGANVKTIVDDKPLIDQQDTQSGDQSNDQDLDIVELDDAGRALLREPVNVDAKSKEEDEDDDDAEEEDTRAGHSEDDDPDFINANDSDDVRAKKRRNQRAKRKDKVRNAFMENQYLRDQNTRFQQQLVTFEQQLFMVNLRTLDGEVMALDRNIQEANNIKLLARKAGNVEDELQADQLAQQYSQRRAQLAQQRVNLTGSNVGEAPKRIPTTTAQPGSLGESGKQFAREFVSDNPWYITDPGRQDEDSAIARAVDMQLAKTMSPETPEYWQELRKRLRKRLPHRFEGSSRRQGRDEGDEEEDEPEERTVTQRRNPNGAGKSGGPRLAAGGAARAGQRPALRKNQVYITPARKQAMIDAGSWDDPVRRQAQLREYQKYDAEHAND